MNILHLASCSRIILQASAALFVTQYFDVNEEFGGCNSGKLGGKMDQDYTLLYSVVLI